MANRLPRIDTTSLIVVLFLLIILVSAIFLSIQDGKKMRQCQSYGGAWIDQKCWALAEPIKLPEN